MGGWDWLTEGVALHHIEASGMRIGYRRAGHGPPVVLLHGAMCDSRVWRLQLEELSGDFSGLAWDAPGCGESSDPLVLLPGVGHESYLEAPQAFTAEVRRLPWPTRRTSRR